MGFPSLLQISPVPTKTTKPKKSAAESSQNAATGRKPARDKRGCAYCPLNEIKGINKIFGKVRGKSIFIWAQSPGAKENTEQKELIGPSGKWLWEELARVGITRDKCDIQNVVRCLPADINKHHYPPLQMRTPTKEEVKCCSVYNEEALLESKAKLHLVFGKIAADSLLKKELKKDKRVFYSDNLKGWVVYLDHPSFFIRQGYQAGDNKPANAFLKRFRDDLDRARSLLKNKSFDRFKFIKSQNYIGCTTTKTSRKAYRVLLRAAREKHIRLVGDMEEGSVRYEHGKRIPDEQGKRVALCCGFTAKPGTTYVFILEHPHDKVSERCRRLNRKLVRRLMRYSDVHKAFHYGASDVDAVRRLLNADVRGFDYDTLLGEYFDNPDGFAFGLDAVSQKYGDFSDYKDIIGPDSFTPEYHALWEKQKGKNKKNLGQAVDDAKSKKMINLARLPWKKILMYNGADNHLAALSMRRTKKIVNPPLMRAYVDSSFILYRMQRERACQPLFDYKWYPRINRLLTLQIKKVKRRVCKLAGKYAYIPHKRTGEIIQKAFSPGSGDHIKWLLYEKLKYKFVGKTDKDKPNTKADTLERLALNHPKVKYILEYRRATKAKSTYTKGYFNCANNNDGHLRTKWKQTGTSTGRLSSGKDKHGDSEDTGVVNLQNIHGDELIKCLLISDPRWRAIYNHYKKYGKFTKKSWKRFSHVWVFLGSDFSQNELRQLAEESGDKELQRIFASKKKWKCDVCGEMHAADPHVDVGHSLTGWSKGKIAHDDRIRKFVKNMQFGLVYGLQGHGLYLFIIARGVDTTEDEVNKYHAKYFKRFKGVAVLQERYRSFAKKHGYVVNQFGFRRALDINDDRDRNEGKKGPWWGNQAVNCVDYKTEALTQRGWVKGKYLRVGDVLLTYNSQTRNLEWQSATDIKLFPDYTGPVHRLSSKSFSAATTPDHRWLINQKGRLYERTSATLPNSGVLPRVGTYKGPARSNYTDDFIRLIGWVLTDGSYGRRAGKDNICNVTNMSGWAANGVFVCQSKPNNVKQIDALFQRLRMEGGLHYRTKTLTNKLGAYDERFWSFSGTYGRWFKGVFPHRILTPEFLVQLPNHQLNILLRTMLKGDGFLARSAKGIDAYQMLAYLCGKASTVRYRDMSKYTPVSSKMSNVPKMTGIWGGKILSRTKISLGWVKRGVQVEKVGMWCPMVPNTFFVARRKGTVYITGNTPLQGAAHQLLMFALAVLHRKKHRYPLLKFPQLEIHDALYFRVRLKDLWNAVKQSSRLLTLEPLKVARKDFKIKKKIPLVAKPKAGFRFGVQIEGIGGGKLQHEWDFLNAWCEANKQLQKRYRKRIAKLAA